MNDVSVSQSITIFLPAHLPAQCQIELVGKVHGCIALQPTPACLYNCTLVCQQQCAIPAPGSVSSCLQLVWLSDCVMADSLSRSGWMMWLRLSAAGLGVLMGCMVFFVFIFGYGNIAAGSWALVSAMFAGLVLHLHLVYRMHRLELWYTVKRWE